MLPCGHQIDQAFASDLRIKSFHQLRTLGCDAPVTFTALAGSTKMTTHSKQGGGSYIAGICTQCNGLYYVGSTTDTSANNKRHIITDTFIPESLVNSSQCQLNRNTYIVTNSGRSRTGTTTETINRDNISTASCNTTCNSCNIMNSSNLYNNWLLVFSSLF